MIVNKSCPVHLGLLITFDRALKYQLYVSGSEVIRRTASVLLRIVKSVNGGAIHATCDTDQQVIRSIVDRTLKLAGGSNLIEM